MQKEEEKEESAMDSLLCPSFSTYSSNNLNDVAQQVINENDNSHSQNDKDDFEFTAFQKTADEVFFDHSRGNSTRGVFPIFNSDVAEISIPLRELMIRDGDRRNSDAVDISIALRKVITGDQNWNIDTPSSSSSDVKDDLDAVSPESYCLWTPKSPMASPIKCKKSNSTGSSSISSSSKRWKFLSLLRRSKSDGKESLILVTPTLEFKKEVKVDNSKVNSGGKGRIEKHNAKMVKTKIPLAERNIPAMEAFYLRKKEIKKKSYLPYKQELIGFGGRGFPLHA